MKTAGNTVSETVPGVGEAAGQVAQVGGEFWWGLDLEVDVEHAEHERDQGEGVRGEFQPAGVCVDGSDDAIDVSGDLRGGGVESYSAPVGPHVEAHRSA